MFGSRIGPKAAVREGRPDLLVGYSFQQIIPQSLALLAETSTDKFEELFFAAYIQRCALAGDRQV